MKQHFIAASLLLMACTAAHTQQFTAGDITIEQPWSRETPKGAPVAGGYLLIRNTGKTSDRLTGGSIEQTDHVEVHEMSMDGNVMKMRQLNAGLEIPAGGTVILKPGSYHLMLVGLKKQLAKGDVLHGTLTFERAGAIPVDFKVAGMGDPAPAVGQPAAGDSKPMTHDSMHMNH